MARGVVAAAVLNAQAVVRLVDGACVVQGQRRARGVAAFVNGRAIGNPVAALQAQHRAMFGLAAFQCLAQRQIGGDGRKGFTQARRTHQAQNALHRRVDGNDLLGLIHRQDCLLQRVQHRVELFVSPGLQLRHPRQLQSVFKALADAGIRACQLCHGRGPDDGWRSNAHGGVILAAHSGWTALQSLPEALIKPAASAVLKPVLPSWLAIHRLDP